LTFLNRIPFFLPDAQDRSSVLDPHPPPQLPQA